MKRTLLLLLCCSTLALAAREIIKIGVVLPLSGNQAASGEDVRDALRMAEDRVRVSSTRYDYKLVFEDGQNQPRLSVEAFRKLSDIDHVDAVLSVYGAPGSAISPMAAHKGILHIGCGFSDVIAAGPLNFNNLTKPAPSAALLLRYLQAAGYRRIACISQQNASTNALEDALLKIIPGSTMEIVNLQKFNPGERDFRVQILRAREANPDLILIHGYDPECSIILKQMKDISLEVPISAMGHWGTLKDTTPFRGIPYVDPKPTEAFTKAFANRYGHAPFLLSAMVSDSFTMLAKACETYTGDGKPSSEFIAKQLLKTKNYPGNIGSLTCDADGWFDSPASVVIFTTEGRRTVSMDEAVRLAHQRWGVPTKTTEK